MQFAIDTLKAPCLYTARQVLGGCVPENFHLKDYVYVTATISAIGLLVSLPFWFIGDLLEAGFGKSLGEREITLIDTPTEKLALDPKKTKLLGFPFSAYQESDNPNFCEGSDWHGHLPEDQRPNAGINILSDAGRKFICDITQKAGGNTVRISLEMAEIRKNPGAMAEFVKTVKYIKERKLLPIVVFHHFVTPLDKEGHSLFESSAGTDEFVKFAITAYWQLKDHTSHFITFNEPHVNAVCNYILGDFPAKGVGQFYLYQKVVHNMLDAHKRIHTALHEVDPNIKVGMTHQALRFVADSRWNYVARAVAFVFTHIFHDSFMRWAEKNSSSLDMLGVQYYTRPYIAGFPPKTSCPPGGSMVTPMRFRFDPEGILPVLQEVGARLPNVPLFVSETGTAGNTDNLTTADQRVRYFDRSLRAVRMAQDSGVNVQGYMPWTGTWEWPDSKKEFSPADRNFSLWTRHTNTDYQPSNAYNLIAGVFNRTLHSDQQQVA